MVSRTSGKDNFKNELVSWSALPYWGLRLDHWDLIMRLLVTFPRAVGARLEKSAEAAIYTILSGSFGVRRRDALGN